MQSLVKDSIFMESIEQETIESSKLKSTGWYRYVDDTLVIWPHKRQKLNDFLQQMNWQHTNINFTTEIVTLPFLGVLAKHDDNNNVSHIMSHHPQQSRSRHMLLRRAGEISYNEHTSSEVLHVHNALQKNGYTTKDILIRRKEN